MAVVNEAKYVQHSPHTQEGSEGLAELSQRLSKTSRRVEIVRAFETPASSYDRHRIDNGKICPMREQIAHILRNLFTRSPAEHYGVVSIW